MQHEMHFVQETSREAFASVQPHLSRIRSMVMCHAREAGEGGFTDHELAARYPDLGYNIRATRCHLVKDGLLVDTGKRRIPSGATRRCIVWAVNG